MVDSFETYLQTCWNEQKDVARTSQQSSLAGQDIKYAKYNLQIHYPPADKSQIEYYQEAYVGHTSKKSITYTKEKVFRVLNKNDTKILFGKKSNNIISNDIPHGIVAFDDRDTPRIKM